MSSILKAELASLKQSLYYPILFVGILWIIKIAELTVIPGSLAGYGIYPRHIEGLIGILTAPLIHGDARTDLDTLGNFSHLFSNSIPLIVLGFLIHYSYRNIAWRVFGIIYLLTGSLTWLFARGGSYHIGASGLVYGFAFFVFFSGVFRKDVKSMALALLVVLFYGGLIWGILPIQPGVSWEGHLFGAISGILAAYLYRNTNRVDLRYPWQDEPEENPRKAKENPFWLPKLPELEEPQPDTTSSETTSTTSSTRIDIPVKSSDDILQWEVKYHIVPKKETNNDAPNH